MEVQVIRKRLVIGILATAILALAGSPSRADDDDNDPAALAKALPEASVTLDQGLKASQNEGNPISGKYEIHNGALQLSVYTVKSNQFSEVIVDHKSGAIKKAEKITEGDDLKDAKDQSAAITKANLSLDQAIENAAKSNSGYRAVSVVPMLAAGRPVANVTLMKGANVKKVAEKLD
jgi:hypothetical protein